MTRITIPVVEVCAPDGTRSFWVAYSIPHSVAVAAVMEKLPPDYTAELSMARLPRHWTFEGARPGDVIDLGADFPGHLM